MLGKCFSCLCIISFIFALITGNMKNLGDAIVNGASKSVTLIISLTGIMALWNGALEVLKKCGAISFLSKILSPVLRLVFPKAFKNGIATEEITACVSANVLGISSSATPMGIEAIKKLKGDREKDVASNDMISLCAISSFSFCLVPTTIIAIRQSHGASVVYEIVPLVWITSFCCMALSIILCRILGRVYEDS